MSERVCSALVGHASMRHERRRGEIRDDRQKRKNAQLRPSDALTRIVEMATIGSATTTPIVELLKRWLSAATYGSLPPPAPRLVSAGAHRAADSS